MDRELRRRHLFGQQQQRGRRHQRQDYRSDRQRHRQSRRQGVRHRQRQWPHDYHGRPPVRPQRRRNVQAIGRLHRKVDSGETVALLRAHLDARRFGYWNKSLWKVQFNVRSELTLVSLLISAAMASAALAQSGSAGGSIGNDEKSLSGSREAPRAVEPSGRHAAPNLNPMSRAAHREEAAVKAVAVAAAISMATWVAVAVGHALRQQHREICHLRWQDFGRTELRVGQPKWLHEDRRIRPGSELEQYRPFLGPHRLRLVRAIRWMYRTLDRVQTVEKRPQTAAKRSVFAASARPIYGCPQAPIIPHPLRNCGSLRPNSPTRLSAPSVAYQYRGSRCQSVPRSPSRLYSSVFWPEPTSPP